MSILMAKFPKLSIPYFLNKSKHRLLGGDQTNFLNIDVQMYHTISQFPPGKRIQIFIQNTENLDLV